MEGEYNMKTAFIYGNMSHYDNGLGAVVTRIRNIFAELGVDSENVDLGTIHPPYYDGETTNAIDTVMENVKESKGIVLACTAQLFSPTAIMLNFLEYLEHADYKQAFEGKHYLLITLSQNGGEKSALEYLSRVVQFFGGYVVAQIGLQTSHLAELSGGIGEFIDKTAEDFYRAAHQGRKYVIPTDYVKGETVNVISQSAQPAAAPITTDPLLNAINIHTLPTYFTDRQEQEVDEISRLFSEKYSNGDFKAPVSDEQEFFKIGGEIVPISSPKSFSTPLSQSPVVEYRAKTVQQITQNLPRYFQPQLSSGLQCVIQLNISGDETFQGFIYIHSTECSYNEGTAPAPDIIVMADSAVWMDVLKGKHTAQKAFMIGGIKVRGDFVLLTKFDALFKLENV